MSTKYLNIYEFKSAFSHFAREVLKGRSFIIAMRNKPFAEIRPLTPKGGRIVFGTLRGKFQVPDNFDAPIEDFERNFYGSN